MSTLQDLRDAFDYLAGDGTEPVAESVVISEDIDDRPRPRRRRWAAAVVTAVVVAGVVSAVVAVQSDRSTTVAPVAPTPTGSVALTPDANREAAEAEADRLLGLVPRPAGAVESDTAPLPALAQEPFGQLNAVTRRIWWTAPVTLEDAITTVTTSLPGGLTGRVLGAEPGSSVTRIQIDVPGPPLPGGAVGPGVFVDLLRHGDLVGGLVQVSVPWTPASTSDPLVPPPVAEAQVETSRPGHPTLHHTLTQDQAADLVDLVDSEPAASLEANCPIALIDAVSDTITVTTANGVFVIGTTATGCRTLEVTAPTGYTSVRQGGGELHDRIVALFDLQDPYR